jgi:hypothetical protein
MFDYDRRAASKVVWVKNTLGPRLTKGKFGAPRSMEYQDAPWSWAVKAVSKWKGPTKQPTLFLRVLPIDLASDKLLHDQAKRFPPNALRQAKAFAKELVVSGKADAAEVAGFATGLPAFPASDIRVVETFGSFERQD